ncbi:MAG: hypothetical protein L0Z48_07025 [candidate division Zixibacteria bacterium]|nr:hypothetical protein [candidate division Zixibacteria bacterium]
MEKFTRIKNRVDHLAKGDVVTLELGFCPFCKSLTDFRGEFLPCCGEDIDTLRNEKKSTTIVFEAKVTAINELDLQKLSAFTQRIFKG